MRRNQLRLENVFINAIVEEILSLLVLSMSHKSIAYILMATTILAMGTVSKIYADLQIVVDSS